LQELIGKLIELQVRPVSATLTYTARITGFDKLHFWFTDKFGTKYGFRRIDLIETKEVKDDE
jgi:hypothetical protein